MGSNEQSRLGIVVQDDVEQLDDRSDRIQYERGDYVRPVLQPVLLVHEDESCIVEEHDDLGDINAGVRPEIPKGAAHEIGDRQGEDGQYEADDEQEHEMVCKELPRPYPLLLHYRIDKRVSDKEQGKYLKEIARGVQCPEVGRGIGEHIARQEID